MTLACLEIIGGRPLKLGVLTPLTTDILKLVRASRLIVLLIIALSLSR